MVIILACYEMSRPLPQLPTNSTGNRKAEASHVDKYRNCNIVCIGDYHRPKVRLLGPRQ